MAVAAAAQNAAPVTYFGQEAPNSATYTLTPTGGAVTARNSFLSALDPSTVLTYDFESDTPVVTDAVPPRVDPGTLDEAATGEFQGYGDNSVMPFRLFGRNGSVIRNQNNSNLFGTWATSGNQYLFAQAFDGSRPSVTDATPDGTTQIALRLQYDPSLASAGSSAKPFSAFGAYITDTEGYATIRLTLTPLGGATPTNPLVVLDYGPVSNQGAINAYPGNAQTSFIGFTDFDSQYETIEIQFTDRRPNPSGGAPLDNEAYGFDDFVIGEINQVNGPAVAGITTRDLAQVDEPGWRLLSAPVRGVTVDDLAQQNLVQGVAAGAETAAQYPEAGSNFYWAYGGGTRWDYTPVPTTDTELRPGRGFWWYWYDVALTPDPTGAGGGTSASVELDNFQLSAAGPELRGAFSESFQDNTDCTSDPAVACPVGRVRNGAPPPSTETPTGTQTPRQAHTPEDDDYYMIGNPFPFPMDFSAVTATGGTLAAQGVIWNPDNQSGTFPRTNEDIAFDGPGSYEMVFANPAVGQQGAVAVWNGVLVEVTKAPAEIGDPVVFTFDPAVAATSETPLFHGKGGDPVAGAHGAAPEAYIQFGLFGETASGAKTRDELGYLRFVDGAQFAWDPMDASKPAWPFDTVGLIGVEGERDGEVTFQAVKALPREAAKRQTNLALKLSEPGTYELVWKSEGLRGRLYDSVTGQHIRLHEGRYVFTADATDGEWARRFVLKTSPGDLQAAPKSGEREVTIVGMPTPNPTRDAFALDIAADAPAEVSVYDALGRLVFETVVQDSRDGQTLRVPTKGFVAGAYLVVVEAPGVRETRRLTVVR